MRSRSGAELRHRGKVRNIAKVSAEILSIERVSAERAGFGMSFTLGMTFPEYHTKEGVASANNLRLDSTQRRLKLAPDYYPLVRLPAFVDFNFCESAKTPSPLTRMAEREGERLCLGTFNVRSLYKKVPRRRSTYVEIPIDANMTHKFSRDGRGSAISSRKISLCFAITFQVNKPMLLCMVIDDAASTLSILHTLIVIVSEINGGDVKNSLASNSRLITLEFIHSNHIRRGVDVRVEDT